jgi:hypothetical protein
MPPLAHRASKAVAADQVAGAQGLWSPRCARSTGVAVTPSGLREASSATWWRLDLRYDRAQSCGIGRTRSAGTAGRARLNGRPQPTPACARLRVMAAGR